MLGGTDTRARTNANAHGHMEEKIKRKRHSACFSPARLPACAEAGRADKTPELLDAEDDEGMLSMGEGSVRERQERDKIYM